jgi:hypothetical protein
VLGHGVDRLIGIARLGDDIQVGFQLDQPLETFTDNGVVIYKNDSWHRQNVTVLNRMCASTARSRQDATPAV